MTQIGIEIHKNISSDTEAIANYVEKEIRNSNLTTRGSINNYKILIDEFSDGDLGIVVKFPTWIGMDDRVIPLFKLMTKILENAPCEYRSVLPPSKEYYKLDLCVSACDPD